MPYLKLAVVALLLVVGCDRNWTKKETQDAHTQGVSLVQAIKLYRMYTGTYPPTLQGLAPKYILKVPEGWQFQVIGTPQKPSALLIYAGGTGPAVQYDFGMNCWQGIDPDLEK